MAVEGVEVAVAAWFAADGIAAQLLTGKEPKDPWEVGRRLGHLSLAVAVALVLVWGVAGVAFCCERA